MTPGDLIFAIVASVGGSSVVLAALVGWLGKVWANRIQELDKARFAREIEADKARFARDLEMMKSTLEAERSRERRNSDAQFKLYNDIWVELQDLKLAADHVWASLDEHTLHNFLAALVRARGATEKARLLLEENDYANLRRLLEVFEHFQVGKLRLYEFRTSEQFLEHYHADSHARIRSQIEGNRQVKSRYDQLLDHLVREFRRQLALAA
jgi:hypothetical protein